MAALPVSLFNADWYLRQYPDVAEAVAQGLISPWEHFDQYGRHEGRSPGPLFDTTYYLAANPDVRAAVEQGLITAYDHFIQHGAGEGRSPLTIFKPDFYLAHNPDVAAAARAWHLTATEHFLLHGHGEPRQITYFLNLNSYVRVNPDVNEAVGQGAATPMEHLLAYGFAEGRDLGNGVHLNIFAQDPVFRTAIENGDGDTALSRVGGVAPFLPTFQRPAGWEPAHNTPIPVDFVPPAGMKLIIPPSVDIPPDLKLPDYFDIGPRPGPGPGPEPPPMVHFDVELIGAAGRPSGDSGTYAKGDVIILAFSRPVILDSHPFDSATAARLGSGYTVKPVNYEEAIGPTFPGWIGDDVREAWQSTKEWQQYRITIGDNPELATTDKIRLLGHGIKNDEGHVARNNLEFSASGGTLKLTGPLNSFLAHEVDYELYGDSVDDVANIAFLHALAAEPDSSRTITGSPGTDYFIAYGSDTLSDKLILKDGNHSDIPGDRVDAILDQPLHQKYAPKISGIAAMSFDSRADGAGLWFSNIQDVTEVLNASAQHSLTLMDVQNVILAHGFGVGASSDNGADFIIRYDHKVDLQDAQAIVLTDSKLGVLSITKVDDNGIPVLANDLQGLLLLLDGDNTIASFTDTEGAAYSLTNSVKLISVGRGYDNTGDESDPCGCPGNEPSLTLGEVWNGLTIDISEMQGGGRNKIDLDLSEADLANYCVNVELASLSNRNPGEPWSSDQRIKLMGFDKIDDGANLTLANTTLAFTNDYTQDPVQNDVIDLTKWNLGNTSDFANHVESLEISKGESDGGDDWYVNFVFTVNTVNTDEADSDAGDIFTFTLQNVVMREAYNKMLQALDTVYTHEMGSTLDLISYDGDKFTKGNLYNNFKLDDGTDPPITLERTNENALVALTGLVGILVDEGTFLLTYGDPV